MKRKTTKLMALIISVLMLMALLPTTAFAADVTVNTFADLRAAVADADGPTTIYIGQDISFTGQLLIPTGKEITITSAAGNNFTLRGATNYLNMRVEAYAKLTLENITMDGHYASPGIQVSMNGQLFVENGVVMTGFTSNQGGAISIGQNATAVINGGEIIGNGDNRPNRFGGAIYIFTGGKLIINSGKISGNTADVGGAIYSDGGSTIDIYGGEISGNTAGRSGGGIYNVATINIYGGVIENNYPDNISGGGRVIDHTNPCAGGHDYIDDPDSEDYIAPACTTTGFMPTVCSVCGEAGAGYELPALGHTPGDRFVIKEPTRTDKGEWEIRCEVCGELLESGEIEELGISEVTTDIDCFATIKETAKNSRVWEVTFTVTVTLTDEDGVVVGTEVVEYVIYLDGNNSNLSGVYTFDDDHDLAGYALIYDIKGNGSNIKAFSIIQN